MTPVLFQQIIHSLIILLGFWKLWELLIGKVIVPFDRWQESRQVTRAKRAEWQKEEERE